MKKNANAPFSIKTGDSQYCTSTHGAARQTVSHVATPTDKFRMTNPGILQRLFKSNKLGDMWVDGGGKVDYE